MPWEACSFQASASLSPKSQREAPRGLCLPTCGAQRPRRMRFRHVTESGLVSARGPRLVRQLPTKMEPLIVMAPKMRFLFEVGGTASPHCGNVLTTMCLRLSPDKAMFVRGLENTLGSNWWTEVSKSMMSSSRSPSDIHAKIAAACLQGSYLKRFIAYRIELKFWLKEASLLTRWPSVLGTLRSWIRSSRKMVTQHNVPDEVEGARAR